ncbi:MAG: hypothetical protein Tsb0017_16790 [Geothermobacteraceae bacterium]
MTRVVAGLCLLICLIAPGACPSGSVQAADIFPLDLTGVGRVATSGAGRLLADVEGVGLDRNTRVSLVRAFGNSDLVKGRLKLFATVEDMARSGVYLYLANNSDGLVVVDVSRPDRPEVVASLQLPGRVQRVLLHGDMAVLLSVRQGLHLVDISDPASPRLIRTLPLEGVSFDIIANDSFLYLTSVRRGIGVFRFDVQNLEPLGLVRTRAEVWDLALDDDWLAVAQGREGLALYRGASTGRLALERIVELPDACRAVSQFGENRFAVRGQRDLFTVDFSSPGSPQIGVYRNLVAAGGGMAWRDDILYWGGYKGLFISRIAQTGDLLAPGMVVFPSGVRSMLLDGNFLWVADQENGLEALDLTADVSVADRSLFHLGGRALDMAVQQERIFLTGHNYDLLSVRIDAGGRLVPEGRMVDRLQVISAAAEGDLLFLGTRDRRLLLVDVRKSPDVRARLVLPDQPSDMVVHDGSLFVAAGSAGVMHFQLQGVAAPRLVGALPIRFKANALAVTGNRLYVADRQGGIQFAVIGAGGSLREISYDSIGARLVDLDLVAGHLYAVTADGQVWAYRVEDDGRPAKRPEIMQLPGPAVQMVGNDRQLFVRLRNGNLFRYRLEGNGDRLVPRDPLLMTERVDFVDLQANGLAVVHTRGSISIYDPLVEGAPRVLAELDAPESGKRALLLKKFLLVYDRKHFVAFWPLNAADREWISFGGKGTAIAVDGELAAIAGLSQLRLVAVPDDGEPAELARLALPGEATTVHWYGKIAVCFVRNTGLVLVDCADPAHPSIVGRYPIDDKGTFALGQRGRLLVATLDKGFLHLDISDPTRPVLLDHMQLAEPITSIGRPANLVVQGNYAFVADHVLGLLVIRLSEDGQMKLVATRSTGGTPYSLALSDDLLFLSDWKKGIMVFDILRPDRPTLVALLPGTTGCRHLKVVNGRLVVNDDKLKAVYSQPLPQRGRVVGTIPKGIRIETGIPEQAGRYMLFAADGRSWDLLPLIDVDVDGQVRLVE